MPIATIAIDLLIALLNNTTAISQLIKTAQAQGRDITPAELQSVVTANTAARDALVAAIAAAKAAGK